MYIRMHAQINRRNAGSMGMQLLNEGAGEGGWCVSYHSYVWRAECRLAGCVDVGTREMKSCRTGGRCAVACVYRGLATYPSKLRSAW